MKVICKYAAFVICAVILTAVKMNGQTTYSSNENENKLLEKSVVSLINDGYDLRKNLEKYGEYLMAKYGYKQKLKPNELDNALMQEKRKFDIENKQHLKIIIPFLEYIKANILTRDYINPYGTYYEKRNSDAISLYKNCVNGFLRLNSPVSNQFLADCYGELKRLYENSWHKMAAAIYQRKILDLQDKYWKVWGDKSPWSNSQFSDYIQLLADTRQYGKIVEYCNRLLADERLKALDKSFIEDVQETRDDAQSMLGNVVIGNDDDFEAVSEELSELMQLYAKGDVAAELIDGYHTDDDIEAFFEYLLKEKKDYRAIFKICAYAREFVETHGIGEDDLLTEDDVAKGRCTQYDLEISREREFWKHANGISTIWKTYHYAALAYLEVGDYVNAIKYQKRAVDNVRTDWKYEGDECGELIDNHLVDRETTTASMYFHVEIEMWQWLAKVYLRSKKYIEAYELYERILKLNMKILENYLLTYSIDTRQEEWLNYYSIYADIIATLVGKTDEFPVFTNLVLEASVMQKGFMLNQTRLVNELKGKGLAENERLFEKANYVLSSDKDSYVEQIADYDFKNYSLLENGRILERSAVPIDRLKSRLGSNDVLVDFFAVESEEIISKILTRQCENGEWQAGKMDMTDARLYACVMRNNWACPKLICIGKLSDLRTESNVDVVEYLVVHDNEPAYIKELYNDAKIGNMVWGKILREAVESEEDNIYFVPDHIFNKIAVENLTIANGKTLSGCYKVRRISSVNEIKENSKFSSSDACAAFGGTVYTNNANRVRQGNMAKATQLNSDARALLHRDILPPLKSSANILSAIARYVPNTTVNYGKDANETEFYKLDGNSPEILFFGTHGFCYNPSDLDEEHQKYLFGKYRDQALLEEEKYMYTSGLFLAPANNPQITTDGILTAREVSMTNLSGTKLAILSACSTGDGMPWREEGVYGLLRGFKMAGVQSVLATLWEVDENATELFITEFFKYYTKGYDKRVALKKAQEFVRDYKSDDVFNPVNYSNPYYWAGFILVD